MHMCNLSAMRMPPLRPSVIAAASVTPPVYLMKVLLCIHLSYTTARTTCASVTLHVLHMLVFVYTCVLIVLYVGMFVYT